MKLSIEEENRSLQRLLHESDLKNKKLEYESQKLIKFNQNMQYDLKKFEET